MGKETFVRALVVAGGIFTVIVVAVLLLNR